MYAETDPRALQVLECALDSSSRIIRLRAVAMLAHIDCDKRTRWLEAALCDREPCVRQTALIVVSWIASTAEPSWPQREDPIFDRVLDLADAAVVLDSAAGLRWEWEYAVEVWRFDGLLMGVFLSVTCQDDDEHAKKMALGQAVLASAGPGADRFDPSTAASFIVAKRKVRHDARPPGGKRNGRRA